MKPQKGDHDSDSSEELAVNPNHPLPAAEGEPRLLPPRRGDGDQVSSDRSTVRSHSQRRHGRRNRTARRERVGDYGGQQPSKLLWRLPSPLYGYSQCGANWFSLGPASESRPFPYANRVAGIHADPHL